MTNNRSRHVRSEFSQWIRDLWYEGTPNHANTKPVTGRFDSNTKKKVSESVLSVLDVTAKAKRGVTGDPIIQMDQKDYRCIYKELVLCTTRFQSFSRFLSVLFSSYTSSNCNGLFMNFLIKSCSDARDLSSGLKEDVIITT